MPHYHTLELTIDQHVAYLTLNRPDKHNSFNDTLIAEMTRCFKTLANEPDVRMIVLTGNGKSFCAGADLNWMKSTIHYTEEQNREDARKLSEMFHTINFCPIPVIGKINGAAIGGGAGLVSVCDIVIASERAMFGLAEVKLGIIPAVISPYMIAKIGESHARSLFFTGERINAQRAHQIGLVHQVVSPALLDAAVQEKIDLIKTSGPQAIRAGKKLVHMVMTLDEAGIREYNINEIARIRVTEEAQEGFAAFLEKRKPAWSL
ncbi:MAG: enoyl-CoA hydratase/isomerase family protein [Gemmatimonadetes bacterium]|nr:MAG: enoyl-CoA hydratase/isomerase family protein [Gemmatimonadota bacterium]